MVPRSGGISVIQKFADPWFVARMAVMLRTLFFLFLLLTCSAAGDTKKGWRQKLERFFCSVDQDGDGEIGQHEATKFLSSFGAKLDLTEDIKSDHCEGKEAVQDFAMVNFKGDFSYGGATISVEEMLDHLQNMLTADHVVDWVTHGLQLPQYAQSFHENAVNGLDFPALIEDNSQTLLRELQVQSLLHRRKITHAIVRQMFGFGAVPETPENLTCVSSYSGAITLLWQPPAFLGYPPLHKYLVQKHSDNASWFSVGDSKETSHMDREVQHGKLYSYRIQAWANHGPSKWSFIHNCHCSDIHTSNTEGNMASQDSVRSFNVEEISNGSKGNYEHRRTATKLGKAFSNWGWVYMVNCLCILFGIISRQSFFIRLILASWTLFRLKVVAPLLVKANEAQNSNFTVCRTASRVFSQTLSSCLLVRERIWNLSGHAKNGESIDVSVNSFSASHLEIESEDFANDDGFFGSVQDTDNRRSSAFRDEDLTFSKKSSNVKQCDRTFQHKGNQLTENSTFFLSTEADNLNSVSVKKNIESTQANKLSNRKRKILSENIDENRLSTSVHSRLRNMEQNPYSIARTDQCHEISGNKEMIKDNESKASSKISRRKRCNYERCKVRFDRWYFLYDWHMNFMKHYCGYCQKVFCAKHTRISIHGALGKCALESNCVCESCFVQLPIELKEKLELRNRLRVGQNVSCETSYSANRKSFSNFKFRSFSLKNKRSFISNKNSLQRTVQSLYHENCLAGDDNVSSSDSSDISLNTSQFSSASSGHSDKTDVSRDVGANS